MAPNEFSVHIFSRLNPQNPRDRVIRRLVETNLAIRVHRRGLVGVDAEDYVDVLGGKHKVALLSEV